MIQIGDSFKNSNNNLCTVLKVTNTQIQVGSSTGREYPVKLSRLHEYFENGMYKDFKTKADYIKPEDALGKKFMYKTKECEITGLFQGLVLSGPNVGRHISTDLFILEQLLGILKPIENKYQIAEGDEFRCENKKRIVTKLEGYKIWTSVGRYFTEKYFLESYLNGDISKIPLDITFKVGDIVTIEGKDEEVYLNNGTFIIFGDYSKNTKELLVNIYLGNYIYKPCIRLNGGTFLQDVPYTSKQEFDLITTEVEFITIEPTPQNFELCL